jgi:hypothetical protein
MTDRIFNKDMLTSLVTLGLENSLRAQTIEGGRATGKKIHTLQYSIPVSNSPNFHFTFRQSRYHITSKRTI